MLTELQEKWCQALESGQYAQTDGTLQNTDGFCCLGVALKILGIEGKAFADEVWSRGTRWYPLDEGEEVTLENTMRTSSTLPNFARDKLGLETTNGGYQAPDRANSLASLNDNGSSFTQIAALIRSEPPGLFKQTNKETT